MCIMCHYKYKVKNFKCLLNYKIGVFQKPYFNAKRHFQNNKKLDLNLPCKPHKG